MEDGTLGMNEVLYIRRGDGINTKAEVVGTKAVAQKLLYVTVDVTNHLEQDLHDVRYYMECNFWKETGDGYTIYSYYPRDEELPEGAQTWEFTGAAGDSSGEGIFFPGLVMTLIRANKFMRSEFRFYPKNQEKIPEL